MPTSLSQSDFAKAHVVSPTPDTHPSQIPGNVNAMLNYWTNIESLSKHSPHGNWQPEHQV